MPRLLTIADAAVRVRVSEQTIRRHVWEKKLDSVKEKGRVMIDTADLDKVFASQLSVPPKPSTPCRIIALANQKGGVGKTTTAANLSAALAQLGHTVLAVDCDPQGNLTQALGPDPDTLACTLYNVLGKNLPLDRAILNPILGQPRLSLVGANLELAAAEQELNGEVARELLLRNALEPYKKQFDFIFLDSPPSLGLLTLNALSAATEVLVPVDVGVFSLRGVKKLLDTIEKVRKVNPTLSPVRALSIRVDNTNLSADVRAELKLSFGENLMQTVIRRSVKFGEAQAAHSPITVHRPKDAAAQDFIQLAKELIDGA